MKKSKHIFKEFLLNFILFFVAVYAICFICFLIICGNQDTFWYNFFYVRSGIFAASLINAVALLFVDFLVINKRINLFLSFIPVLIMLLIFVVGDTTKMTPNNLIIIASVLLTICGIVNYTRFKRIQKYNASC